MRVCFGFFFQNLKKWKTLYNRLLLVCVEETKIGSKKSSVNVRVRMLTVRAARPSKVVVDCD